LPGEIRDVDIEPILDGSVFQPLRDPALFGQVAVDECSETIAWPNGADIDPEVKPAGRGPRVTTPARV